MIKLRVYIGWDERDWLAYQVCRESLIRKSSLSRIEMEIVPLIEWKLRNVGLYERPTAISPKGQKVDIIDGAFHSTGFTYTRFLVPFLERTGFLQPNQVAAPALWSLYIDPDMLWRADIAELLEEVSGSDKAVHVAKHEYEPSGTSKMDGRAQRSYPRKNWSSVMMFNGDRTPEMSYDLNPEDINCVGRDWLHQFEWVEEGDIGELPLEWNWLDEYLPNHDAKLVHFTTGTPDIRGEESTVITIGVDYDQEWLAYANQHHGIDRSLW